MDWLLDWRGGGWGLEVALVRSGPPDWAERPAAAVGSSAQQLSWTSEEIKFISSQDVSSCFEALLCCPAPVIWTQQLRVSSFSTF